MKKLIVSVIGLLALATSAFAQIGSASADLVYTPVTPCRIFDTRTSQGGTGPITAGGTKSFAIWGVGSYAGQGGSPTNCGITAGSNTAAVAVNLVAAFPSSTGWLTAYPSGTTMPLAATLNYNAGEVVVSNGAILKVSQAGTPTDLTVFSSANSEVIADVVGYYSKPVATALECTTVAGVSTVLPASSVNTFAPAPACAAGYTRVSVMCGTGTNNNRILGVTTGGCFSANAGASASTVNADSVCCRIPGR